MSKLMSEFKDAEDGDIYLNPYFGDLWVVDGDNFIKINDGCIVDMEDPSGFIKVGHIEGVTNKANFKPKTAAILNYFKLCFSLNKAEYGFDDKGRIIARSDVFIPKEGLEKLGVESFDGVSFITIDKTDAQNLYEMFKEAIDITALGDKATSFEILCDYLKEE